MLKRTNALRRTQIITNIITMVVVMVVVVVVVGVAVIAHITEQDPSPHACGSSNICNLIQV